MDIKYIYVLKFYILNQSFVLKNFSSMIIKKKLNRTSPEPVDFSISVDVKKIL